MSGNGYGTHRSNRYKTMAEHDALPPELRRVSCYSVAKWAAESLLEDYNRGLAMGLSRAAAAARVARLAAEEEQDDTLEAYGPTHPEAPGYRGARS